MTSFADAENHVTIFVYKFFINFSVDLSPSPMSASPSGSAQPASNDSLLAQPQVILQCSKCSFCHFSLARILTHHRQHQGPFFCGIDTCTFSTLSLEYFRSHVSAQHPEFYPTGVYHELVFGDGSFAKIFQEDSSSEHQGPSPALTNAPSPQTMVDDPIPAFEGMSSHSYGPASPAPQSFAQNELNIDRNVNQFLNILASNGAKIPFKSLKAISDSLIDFFYDIHDQDIPKDELFPALKQSISSQDAFDLEIKNRFGGIYPEMVTIGQTGMSFSVIPLKETIEKNLALFESPRDLILSEPKNDTVFSFFDSDACNHHNTIFLNVFIDDFQLANPLLSKKACDNEMKAFYYRIVTRDSSKFSSREHIHLMALCKTSVFKAHSIEVISYIGNEFKRLQSSGVNASFDGENFNLGVEIAYFSLDSKEASYLLGLKQGFTHNYCCRFCTTSREDFPSTFFENPQSLRDIQSVESALNEMEIRDPSTDVLGIQRKNLVDFFSDSPTFLLAPPCIGHDFYEGVVPKVLNLVFNQLVQSRRLTNLFYKNKIRDLGLRGKDHHSIPYINFNSPNLRLTMNESFYLLRFFALIFGDLFEANCPIFSLILTLIELSCNIAAFHFDDGNIAYLGTLIADFLLACRTHLPSLRLSVKFHYMTHYPRMIKQFGPLRYFNTMNFESHHSFLKSLIKSSNNWKCPAYTISNKYARFSALQGRSQDESNTPLSYNQMQSVEIYSRFSIDSTPGPFFAKISLGGVLYMVENVIFYARIEDIDFFLKISHIIFSNNTYIFCGKIAKGIFQSNKNIIQLEELDVTRMLWYPQMQRDKHCYNVYSCQNFVYIVPFTRF